MTLDAIKMFFCALVALILLGLLSTAVTGCSWCSSSSHSTLTPSAVNDLRYAERDCYAIVGRQDAGMPSADRALATACYCAVEGALRSGQTAGVDAAVACPLPAAP